MRMGKRYQALAKDIGTVHDRALDSLCLTVDRYFGRARELPGVKEMFEASKPQAPDKPLESRGDLRRNVDASYYGYNLDEEDGTLLQYEAQKEKEAYDNLIAQGDENEEGWEPLPGDAGDGAGWKLPTTEQVQEELLNRRQRALLDSLG